MPSQLIPLTVAPNQSLTVTLAINGSTLTVNLALNFNEVGGFWLLNILDASNNPIVGPIPLLTGDWPAGNILSPFEYMQIGELFVINLTGGSSDFPNAQNLARGFALLWTDNS